MSGMECPFCCQELVTKNIHKVADNKNHPAIKRFRTCVNPECEIYLIRLVTMEVLVPLQKKPYIYGQDGEIPKRFTRRGHLPPRTAPVPDEPIPGVNA